MKRLLIIIIFPFLVNGQGNENILNGTWDIISLEYDTELDLSFLEDIIGINPGNQDVNGEANDAGMWEFQYPEYIYNSDLSFTPEPINIPLIGESPTFPIDIVSSGTWSLINNGNTISTTDDMTGLTSSYDIVVLFEEFAIIEGVIPFSQNIMGYDFDLEIELELQLQKQNNSSKTESLSNKKELITGVDITGKETNGKGFQLEIYDDGSVQKAYRLY